MIDPTFSHMKLKSVATGSTYFTFSSIYKRDICFFYHHKDFIKKIILVRTIISKMNMLLLKYTIKR